MIVYENSKIVAVSKNLLNLFNIPLDNLEKISQTVKKIELEMAMLNQQTIELFNITFKIKKVDVVTLKNLDIYLLETTEKETIPIEENKLLSENQLIQETFPEENQLLSENPQPEQLEESLINENDLLNISLGEIQQTLQTPEIEEENKPIELNFNDNISECEKIFEKDNVEENIKKELKLTSEELGIDEEMANDLFKDLLNQFKNKKEELYKAINERNYDEIHKIAHYLKGASLNLRLSDLAFIFKTIDEEAKNKTEIEKIKKLTDKLYDYIKPLYKMNSTEETKKIEIDPKIKKYVLNTIRYYLETQDEKKFQTDKKYIEKLLNSEIDSINDLEKILKEN